MIDSSSSASVGTSGPMLGYLLGEVTGNHAQGGIQNRPIGYHHKEPLPTPGSSGRMENSALPILYAPPEGHSMILAGTGAGKARSVAIPLLLSADNSMIVNDVKGELYAITARRRREMGHAVYCLDFSHLTAGPYHQFNPFDTFRYLVRPDEIEIEAQSQADRLSFGDADLKEAFWDSWGMNLVAAVLIAFVATRPQEEWNLRHFLKQLYADDLVYSLACMLDTFGKKIPIMAYQDIASFLQLAEVTRSGVTATAQSYLKSLMAESVLKATDESDFSLEDIRDGKPVTIYIVFPPDRLSSHGALLRVWIGALLKAMTSRKQIPEKRTLFLLDECAQLGTFEYLETVITLCRSYGVGCLTFWQDLQQIKDRYSGWQTLINNCSVLQFFGCKNHLVTKGVEELTGISAQRIATMAPDEQLVVMNGKNLLSRRFDYLHDPLFAGLFDPNPYYQNRPPSSPDQRPPLIR